MSFKDDFLEAWRSVKRDFFRDTDYAAPTQSDIEQAPPSETTQAAMPPVHSEPYREATPPAPSAEPPVSGLPQSPEDANAFNNFMQASAIPSDEGDPRDVDVYYSQADDEDDDITPASVAPFRHYDSEFESAQMDTDRRAILDNFENSNGVYSDDKTIISRNTVIRGALQTDDSVRLLGQVLGDIDCKSNIVVAGKVRGNTNAANAYIFDAQVDGDVRCDDVINISNDAWVLGNIRAQQAEIDGKIKGNIEIRHVVCIGATSSVLGDISADELEIKRGAFINGQIMMYSPSRDVLDRFDQFGEN